MLERIRTILPSAPISDLAAAADEFEIDTPLRAAHWLAQLAHESAGFTVTHENLNYSVEALLSLFGRHRISEADAMRYGRSASRPANQTGIANCIYGGEWGAKNLGNTQPGDGYRYHGRGFIQTTGRTNYQRTGIGTALPLIELPDTLEKPQAAALSAAWFWSDRELNDFADVDDILAITNKVNGGVNGLADRKAWLAKFKAVL